MRLRHTGAAPERHSVSGFALIVVLWVVAIMSLITVGLVQSVRSEIRVSTMERDRIQAQALGNAAIALAAQHLQQLAQTQPTHGTVSLTTEFDGVTMPVHIQSLSGLLNLETIPVTALAVLLNKIGGLEPAHAEELATLIVQTRNEPTKSGVSRGIESVEDLMQIPGFSYALYARVAPFVTVDKSGSGLYLNASPPEVQSMFGVPSGAYPPPQNSLIANQQLRFTALVPAIGSAPAFAVSRDMRISTHPFPSGLYWLTFESQVRVAG